MQIDFSYNWNNKLNSDAFTTFRVSNSKYVIGQSYKIFLKKQYVKDCTIIDIKRIKLDQVNNFIAYLDTGYSVEEFTSLVKKMYPWAGVDQLYDFILLKTNK